MARPSLSAIGRVRPDSVQSDEFAVLQRRLLIAINQVMLVSQHFGDLTSLSQEDAPAGLTLYQAARDLDRLYNELDTWEVRHAHTPQSDSDSALGRFTDDSPERTPLAGMPPAFSCPFCGRADDIYIEETKRTAQHGPWYVATCGTCGAEAPGGSTLPEAVNGWNIRGRLATPGANDAPPADAEPVVTPALPPIGASDLTADRIRAFVMSVRPLAGVVDIEGDDRYQRGRNIIERMAMSAKDEGDPTITLLPAHCADVLNFLSHVEPLEPQTWWKDPPNSPSHLVGLEFVLRTLERSLRSKEAQS